VQLRQLELATAASVYRVAAQFVKLKDLPPSFLQQAATRLKFVVPLWAETKQRVELIVTSPSPALNVSTGSIHYDWLYRIASARSVILI
jgi:hypothetical protein